MKKALIIILLSMFALAPINSTQAQTAEVTQLILNIEKLNQLRKILKELKNGYEILFKGYNTIRDLSQGNFKLHEAFLDGLLQVSPSVKKYSRVKDIVACQLALVKEYRAAYAQFSSGDHFTAQELAYIYDVYTDLIKGSIKNLDALTTVLTAKKLRASDDERLRIIDSIYEDMTDKLSFLRYFNSNASVLAAQRNSEKADIELRKKIYGIEP
ncbi:TerB family tellurite resistance protein [Dyadobacter sp. 3J3]|uniref:TerB family tellurite resistance protein n=1 Tax=Dyadobacter sp. 3J3 TaxID=2606600 RepID=UPI00135953CB|nr:TerB family tellurite resistance protein [Dyadobacter sp. 3J3]